MQWSGQQAAALSAVQKWLADRSSPVFRVFGYAGTGKSTIARHFAEGLGLDHVRFAAYTGKAAAVLRQKGCEGAMTIHRLAYVIEKELLDEKTRRFSPQFRAREAEALSTLKLIVLDECSMLDEETARDLLSFKVPILVLGDPAQLPPRKGSGYFIDSPDFPLDRPDVLLTEIHRQAAESPVLRLATAVREGRPLLPGTYGDSVVTMVRDYESLDLAGFDQVICGKNDTRTAYNRRVRSTAGRGEYPEVDEKLICLRNSRRYQLHNGERYTVANVWPNDEEDETPHFVLAVGNEELPSQTMRAWWGPFRGEDMSHLMWADRKAAEEFDFSYAITCHKAQGSQYPSVAIFDEAYCFREHARKWRYTALTRAESKVLVAIRS